MSYIIYLLYNTQTNYTYVGITNKIERRIRQHNGIIKGGAKYTKINKREGEWKVYGVIKGKDNFIIEKNIALSIEKKVKNLSKRMSGKTPIERRMKAINNIIGDSDYILFENDLSRS
jgi:structure-specific endonuclease subunit SLX1